MGDFFTQFGVDVKTLIAQIINFGIFLFIFKRYFYKPLIAILAQRKKTIEETIRKNELIDKKLKEIEQYKEKEYQKVKNDVASLIEDSKNRGDELAKEIIKEAQKKSDDLLVLAKEKIKIEKEQIKEELRLEFQELLIEALEKILKKEYSKKDSIRVQNELTELLEK